jgi:hypothetical protein
MPFIATSKENTHQPPHWTRFMLSQHIFKHPVLRRTIIRTIVMQPGGKDDDGCDD